MIHRMEKSQSTSEKDSLRQYDMAHNVDDETHKCIGHSWQRRTVTPPTFTTIHHADIDANAIIK